MSSSRLFENTGGLGDDACAISARETQNRRQEDYLLYNRNYDAACPSGTSQCLRDFGTTNRRVYREALGATSCNVDQENKLLFGQMTHDRHKTQLCVRTFGGVPSIGVGIVMPEVEDRIKQGEIRSSRHTCDSPEPLEAIDRFVPMVPCMQRVVQNPDFIVPDWTWGGVPTRDVDQQRQFLSNSGYVFDGRLWQKKLCAAAPAGGRGLGS